MLLFDTKDVKVCMLCIVCAKLRWDQFRLNVNQLFSAGGTRCQRTGLSGFPHLVLEPVQCSNLCITCSFIFNLYSVLLFCWWSYISHISMMSARGFSHVPCDRPLVPRASKKFTGAACIQLSLGLFLVE